jgi:hypothetical protein
MFNPQRGDPLAENHPAVSAGPAETPRRFQSALISTGMSARSLFVDDNAAVDGYVPKKYQKK